MIYYKSKEKTNEKAKNLLTITKGTDYNKKEANDFIWLFVFKKKEK